MNNTYTEYKISTRTFVKWIVSISSIACPHVKPFPDTLGSLLERTIALTETWDVMDIVSNPILFEPFPNVMLSGYHAIKLRSEFYLFYTARDMKESETAENNDRHLYCITVLKKCYKLLQSWMKAAQNSQDADNNDNIDNIQKLPVPKTSDEMSKHFNVLQCLGDIEDLCETNEENIAEESILNNEYIKGTTIAEIDARIGDLRVSALCLFYDMIAMMKKVKEAWKEVKAFKKSILSAVSVTMVAYHEVEKLMEDFQKKYPAITSADEYYKCCLSANLTDEENELIQKLPIVQEQLHVNRALKFCCYTQKERIAFSHARANENDNPIRGKTYSDYSKFFLVEFKWFVANRKLRHGVENDKYQLSCATCVKAFDALLLQSIVTIPTIFLCQCWFESVYILQDKERKGLGRQLYYLRSINCLIAERIQSAEKELNTQNASTKKSSSASNINVFIDEHGLNDLIYGDATDAKQTRFWWKLLQDYAKLLPDGTIGGYSAHYNNPIMSGCVTIDYLILYNKFCTIMVCNCDLGMQINLIAQLYQKFQSEGYLEPNEIPVLDSLFQAFPMTAYVHGQKPMMGEYYKQYMLIRKCCKPHEIDNYLAEMYRGGEIYQYLPRTFQKQLTANLINRERDTQVQALVEITTIEEILWLHENDKIDAKEKDKLLDNAMKVFEKGFHDPENPCYPALSLDLLYYIGRINKFIHHVYTLIPAHELIYQRAFAGYQPTDCVRGSEKWNKMNHVFAVDRTIGAFLIPTFDLKDAKDCRIVIPTVLYEKIAALMTSYFPSIFKSSDDDEEDDDDDDDDSEYDTAYYREYDFFLIPKEIDQWMMNEFGTVTMSALLEKSTNRDFYETYLSMIECVDELEEQIAQENETPEQSKANSSSSSSNKKGKKVIERKASHKELYAKHCQYAVTTNPTFLDQKLAFKMLIKKYGFSQAILLFQDKHERESCLQTMIHHILFGLWQGDRNFAEWAFQMWGFVSLMIDGLPTERFSYTMLHLAAIHQFDWLGDLLLCEGGSFAHLFVNQKTRVDGNTALHYAIMTGNERLCTVLSTVHCDLHIKNFASCTPIEIVLDEEDKTNPTLVNNVETAKGFMRRMIGVSQYRSASELVNVGNHLSSNFEATELAEEAHLKEVQQAVDAQEQAIISAKVAGKTMHQKKKKRGDNQTNGTESKKCTEEDIRRANQMEQELLKMLEDESTQNKGGTKKKSNNKKKI